MKKKVFGRIAAVRSSKNGHKVRKGKEAETLTGGKYIP